MYLRGIREEVVREAYALAVREGVTLAIVDGEVVDHDRNLDALAARVHARYGLRSVFMPLCRRSPRVVHVRSPRIAR